MNCAPWDRPGDVEFPVSAALAWELHFKEHHEALAECRTRALDAITPRLHNETLLPLAEALLSLTDGTALGPLVALTALHLRKPGEPSPYHLPLLSPDVSSGELAFTALLRDGDLTTVLALSDAETPPLLGYAASRLLLWSSYQDETAVPSRDLAAWRSASRRYKGRSGRLASLLGVCHAASVNSDVRALACVQRAVWGLLR